VICAASVASSSRTSISRGRGCRVGPRCYCRVIYRRVMNSATNAPNLLTVAAVRRVVVARLWVDPMAGTSAVAVVVVVACLVAVARNWRPAPGRAVATDRSGSARQSPTAHPSHQE